MDPGHRWGHGPVNAGAYLENRAALLHELLGDHLVWTEALAAHGQSASLAARWVDQDGQQQITAVHQPFLEAHLRIVRSVMQDLTRCGPEGYLVIRYLFASVLQREHDHPR